MKLQPVALPVTREAKLMHLYSIIENAPPERVDIRSWKCGTAYCIAGWACLDPTFNKMGLKLMHTRHGVHPVFGNKITDLAMITFFDLTMEETDNLTLPGYYEDTVGEGARQEALGKIKELMG